MWLRTSNTTALTSCIRVVNVKHRHRTCKQDEVREGQSMRDTATLVIAGSYRQRGNRQALNPEAGTTDGEKFHVIDVGKKQGWIEHHHMNNHPKRSVQGTLPQNVGSSVFRPLQRLDVSKLSYTHSPITRPISTTEPARTSGDDSMTEVGK